MAPEEVPLYQEILRAIGDLLFGSKKEGTVVVLKDVAANGGRELDWKAKRWNNFSQHGVEWKERAHHAGTGGRVLGLQCS